MLTAVAHPLRLRIVAELAGGRVHVSELARRLDMSRPLLYMHLDRLEKAGMVTGQLELSEDGKAMKYFQLVPFELCVTAETIVAALEADGADGSTHKGETDMREIERLSRRTSWPRAPGPTTPWSASCWPSSCRSSGPWPRSLWGTSGCSGTAPTRWRWPPTASSPRRQWPTRPSCSTRWPSSPSTSARWNISCGTSDERAAAEPAPTGRPPAAGGLVDHHRACPVVPARLSGHGLAAVRRGADRGDRGGRPLDHAGRYPAAGRGGRGHPRVRRGRALPPDRRDRRARRVPLPRARPGAAGPDRPGPRLLDGPGHLARVRLPGRHVRPAGDPRLPGARGLANAGGRGHPAAVVLGAVPALLARLDRARRAARLLPERPVRLRRGRRLRRHAAEGAAHRPGLPAPAGAVQLPPGADRAHPRHRRPDPAPPAGRPPSAGEGPAPTSRAASFFYRPNGPS